MSKFIILVATCATIVFVGLVGSILTNEQQVRGDFSATRLTKQEDSSLYRCSNEGQWWEEGCDRYFTEEESRYK